MIDLEPKDRISEDAVWQDPNLIDGFLTDMYRGLRSGLAQGKLSALTSNASAIPTALGRDIVKSEIGPGNLGLYGFGRGDIRHLDWDHNYEYIRNTNIFISRIDDSAISDQQRLDNMKGEAHFLRAYFYHNLMRAYGGVPLLTEPAELDDPLTVPRNSFAETVDFIVQEAQTAADLLPETRANKNRISKGAALALKARVLMYAASDLFHENPSGMPETGYTSAQDRAQMWRDAKNAALAVRDLGQYSLFRANPAPGDSAAVNYYELFITPSTDESILERYYQEGEGDTFLEEDEPHGIDQYHGPNGYHQWGGNTPTQQLVDSYRMSDGSEFTWDDPEHSSNPYEDRDPRFYASILYDGAEWNDRPSDARQFDEDNVIQTFETLELPEGETVTGVDTRDSPIEPWNGTHSNYYMRKFIDEDFQLPEAQAALWMFFRYGEILLNYAEASIELGEYADAREAINKIRRRANMPEFDASVTGQELKEAYRNERRIELVFEEHRYFDIRRWMIAPETMNQDARGINISAKAESQADRDSYYDYEYQVMSYQERRWDDKMYFKPISQDEMNRNEELVQNPGY